MRALCALVSLLATVQAYGIAVGLESGNNIVTDPGWFFKISAVITLVGGTMFLMWLGEQITQRGIGNGISLIITISIVSRLPGAINQAISMFREGSANIFTLVTMLVLVSGRGAGHSTVAEACRRLATHGDVAGLAVRVQEVAGGDVSGAVLQGECRVGLSGDAAVTGVPLWPSATTCVATPSIHPPVPAR